MYEWYVIQKPCNICNVYNNKGKQAGWVIHLLGQFYSPVMTFRFFRRLERSGSLNYHFQKMTNCLPILTEKFNDFAMTSAFVEIKCYTYN